MANGNASPQPSTQETSPMVEPSVLPVHTDAPGPQPVLTDVKEPSAANDRVQAGPSYRAPQPVQKGRGQSVALAKEQRRAKRGRVGKAVYRSSNDAYQAAVSLSQVKRKVVESYRNIVPPQQKELRVATVKAARHVTKPSWIRYGSWISSCILMDVTGIVVSFINLSGVALFFSTILMWGLMLFMFIWGRVLMGTKLKDIRTKKKELEDRAKKARSDIQTISAQIKKYKKYSRSALRRFPKAAARMTRLTRKVVRLTRFKSVAKLLKFFSKMAKSRPMKFIVEALPFIQALPWWTIGSIAAYVEHKGEWKDAQRVLQEYKDLQGEYIGIATDYHKVRLAVANKEMNNALQQAGENSSA